MTCLVVDANIAVKAVIPNPLQASIEQKFDEWKSARIELYAPSLWWYEVTSTLTKAVHFDYLSAAEAQQALPLLHGMNVQTPVADAALVDAAMAWTFRLKRAAAYDSFYLALAQRLETSLWTTDKRLFNAVGQDWVCYVEK